MNYLNYALALATFLNNFNRLMSTRPLLVLPLSYCKKACANEISPLLCRFVNFSLELGTFPEKWKDANLVPIHKCESKTMVSNYRGISLLHVLSKILERQVYNEIFSIVCSHLTHWQHGFLTSLLFLNYSKSFINSLMLLKRDNKSMLFI